MLKNTGLKDTIVAISTPAGEGGIGIVRLSGRDSLEIADRIFKAKDGKKPSQFETYTTHYGNIIEVTSPSTEFTPSKAEGLGTGTERSRSARNQIIDEVILTVMRAPKSYTKEDVVEINCHGGIIPLKKTLELVVRSGARLAEPGEFTKRAFLNGRIDLAQAEAVLDVIRAKTDISLRAALNQLEGDLSCQTAKLREELLNLYVHIEASIDFPEEEIEILSSCDMLAGLENIAGRIKHLIDTADAGKVLRDGMATVICGKPNVGKSSLMNAFLKEKRVIVSPIPGTTRDVVEEIININGIPLRIADTAGIIESEDLLTKEGVSKSRHYIRMADLVLFLLDASEELNDKDLAILNEVKDKKTIVAVNKIDLPKRLDIKKINGLFRDKKIVEISVEKRINLEKLEDAITEMVWHGEVVTNHETLITNVRHKTALVDAYGALKRSIESLKNGLSAEFTAIHIKEAIQRIGEITGHTVSEDILDRIFSQFCIGK